MSTAAMNLWIVQDGALVRRGHDSWPYGPLASYKPDETTTGVPSGVTLTQHTGDITVTADNTTIEALDVHGFITVQAANCTIRNCIVRGGQATNNCGVITAWDASNLTVEDVEIDPEYPSYWLTGILGTSYTAKRVNAHDVVDGFGSYNVRAPGEPTNVSILGCYVHDLSFFSNDPNHANDSTHPGWTHNDCWQIQGGSGDVGKGNNFQAYVSPTSGTQDYPYRQIPNGLTISPNIGWVTDLLFTRNWIEGGSAGITAGALNPSGDTNDLGEISYNAFGMDQHDYGNGSRYQIRYKSGWNIDGLTTNYFDPNASSVPANLKGVNFSVGRDSGIRIDP